MKKNSDVKIKIIELTKKINYHDELYYKKNYQEISDEEYDKLRKDLTKLEKIYPEEKLKNSPNEKVGKIDSKQFNTIQHNSPMLSLNNAYNKEEVRSFYEKTFSMLKKKFYILAETKVDGLSASLRYENRKLIMGLTRGDGAKGEDITRNLKYIEGIKQTLPEDFPEKLEIRGEIFMKKKNFEDLNKDRKLKGLHLFSTPRNAAAGSVRQLDPEVTRNRKLSFYGYTLLEAEKYFGGSLNKTREILMHHNFSLNHPSMFCRNFDDMIKFYDQVNKIRSQLEYDIDGIVFKLDSIQDQKRIGSTSRWPKWAIAYKFPAENAITNLKDVVFQVGRTGAITPVAILKEVIIGGVKINRATLHNKDEITRLNLSIGDTVSIQRAGDVIPKITSLVKKSNDPVKIRFPDICPSCKSKLYFQKGEAAIRCLNHNFCKEQKIQSLSHFVSRNAFDILGLGDKQLRIFWKKNLIRSYSDIFTLELKENNIKEKLSSVEGFGDKSIFNLFEAIKQSKTIDFDKFIYSLGIRHVGQGVARAISRKFNNVNKFISYFLKLESNEKIEGVGNVILESVRSYFKNDLNLNEVKNLIEEINIQYIKTENLKFSNKVIVITGSFKKYSRKEIEQKLINMGAKISSSISSKTDFLFCGTDPGSKLQKAKKLDIKIFYLDEVEQEVKN